MRFPCELNKSLRQKSTGADWYWTFKRLVGPDWYWTLAEKKLNHQEYEAGAHMTVPNGETYSFDLRLRAPLKGLLRNDSTCTILHPIIGCKREAPAVGHVHQASKSSAQTLSALKTPMASFKEPFIMAESWLIIPKQW